MYGSKFPKQPSLISSDFGLMGLCSAKIRTKLLAPKSKLVRISDVDVQKPTCSKSGLVTILIELFLVYSARMINIYFNLLYSIHEVSEDQY